jgi:four helix bundle protein
MAINDSRDLEVWQLGRSLVRNIYELAREFPDAEKFGLVSQLRRASISVTSNIAESWGRHYTAEFVQFLRKANGSRTEVETQLILSADLRFLTCESLNTVLQQTGLLGKKVLSLERSLLRRGAPQTGADRA